MAEEKEFMTLDEAAMYLEVTRPTLYNYINDLDIKTQKFKRDRKAYLTSADILRIKEYKEKPWLRETRD